MYIQGTIRAAIKLYMAADIEQYASLAITIFFNLLSAYKRIFSSCDLFCIPVVCSFYIHF